MNPFGKKNKKNVDENGTKKVGAADTTRFTAVARRWESPEKSQRRVTILLGLFAAAVLLSPLSFVMSMAAMGAAAGGDETATNANVEGVGETQAFAETMVLDWLQGRTPALPLSRDFPADLGRSTQDIGAIPIVVDALTWKGATTGQGNTQQMGSFTYEVHTFLLRTGELLYDVSATLIITENGPYLAALPSIAPAISAAPESRLNWTEILGASTPIPNNGEDVINEWTAAYVTDNRNALYQLTGDDRRVEYRGIGGYVLNPENGVQILHSFSDGTLLLVRVQIDALNASQPAQKFVLEYDLVLTELQALRPSLVPWGPAGTGTTQIPFSNAVSTEKDTVVETPTTLPPEPTDEETDTETTDTTEEDN